MGKRSGDGFVVHKATLVNALSRGLADRLMIVDFTIGRKGFLGYIKALAGSNVIKVVPASASAGESQTNGSKRLKVSCGSHTSYLEDMAWIGDNTPLTISEVRVSPKRVVNPNIGSSELAEALDRVLPFTAKQDNRPVLQCVLMVAGEGKLKLVSADGFRLAIVNLDCDVEGQALINRDDLKGIAGALRKAQRVSFGFEKRASDLDSIDVMIDTELARYRLLSADGTFPDYEKLVPTEFNTVAHIDTVEARKAISSLKALADSKAYPIDLTLADGKIVLSSPDEKGTAELLADVDGGDKVRIDGGYLTDALRACGGMVDFKLTDGKSPTVFNTDGYTLVVMPMLTADGGKPTATTETAEQTEPAEPEAEPAEDSEPVEDTEDTEDTEPAAEPVEDSEDTEPAASSDESEKPKRRSRRKRELAAVA